MDNCRQVIRGMLDDMIHIREDYRGELRDCPRGSLWKTKLNGQDQYYWAFRKGDIYVRRSISNDEDMQRQLARKAYLIKSLKLLDRNIYQLRRALDGLEPMETGAVVARLTKAYQNLPGEYFLGSTEIHA